MSQDNVELARRMIEWFNARDRAAAQAQSTDDVELVPLRAAMEGTTYQGPDAFAAFGTAIDEAWDHIQFEPATFRAGGERVVAIGRLSARGRGTGAEVSATVAMLFEFRGGLLSNARSYPQVEEALEAAGLLE